MRPMRLMGFAAACVVLALGAGCSEPPRPPEGRNLIAPAIAAMEDFDFEKALGLLTEAERKAPFDPKVLYALGKVHGALDHDAIAAAYLSAYLKAWGRAPGRESAFAEFREHMGRSVETGYAMLTMAADLALALPEENRADLPPGSVTEKQRIIERVLQDLILANNLAEAERLATAYPIGATMAIGAGMARAYALDSSAWNVVEAMQLAERIAKIEARASHARYVADLRFEVCRADEVCPFGPTTRWREPRDDARATLKEGVLKIGLSTWVWYAGQPGHATRLFEEGLRQARSDGPWNVYLTGTQLPDARWMGTDLFDGASPFAPRSREGKAIRGRTIPLVDAHRALIDRGLTTGEPGELIRFDDRLLVDTEGLVASFAALPPHEAIVALSEAGRKLARLKY